MSTRAAAMEVTRERIVEVATSAFAEHWYDDVTLREVAQEAGVALQTVRNHFSSKEELFLAASERMTAAHESARWATDISEVDQAIGALVDDYERTGDTIMRMLAIEERVSIVQPHIAIGRREHQRWCEEAFAAALAGLRGAARARRVAQLVVATDVYCWKLLRRDKGLSREDTEKAIKEIVVALHGGGGGEA